MSSWIEYLKLTWQDLTRLSNEELERIDIALRNLLCAADLPGTDKIDIPLCLRTLDDWAEQIRWYTMKSWRLFERNPQRYWGNRNYFRIEAMITYLQRDLGARYNPAKIPADAPFDAADTFIHGIIQGGGGTCATLPVLYVAVGRRLGYPLKLAHTIHHAFVRWDDPSNGDRFNIEANAKGVGNPSDTHYRTGRYHLTPKEETHFGYLQSMSPRREVAAFLLERALRWRELHRLKRAAESYIGAWERAPEVPVYRDFTNDILQKWGVTLQGMLPEDIPKMTINFPPRKYTNVSLHHERKFIYLEAIEDCARQVARWHREKARVPATATVTYPGWVPYDLTPQFVSWATPRLAGAKPGRHTSPTNKSVVGA